MDVEIVQAAFSFNYSQISSSQQFNKGSLSAADFQRCFLTVFPLLFLSFSSLSSFLPSELDDLLNKLSKKELLALLEKRCEATNGDPTEFVRAVFVGESLFDNNVGSLGMFLMEYFFLQYSLTRLSK